MRFVAAVDLMHNTYERLQEKGILFDEACAHTCAALRLYTFYQPLSKPLLNDTFVIHSPSLLNAKTSLLTLRFEKMYLVRYSSFAIFPISFECKAEEQERRPVSHLFEEMGGGKSYITTSYSPPTSRNTY